MIVFLYPFDLFGGLFIVLLDCDGFQHSVVTGFIEVKVKVHSKFMRIAIISKNS